VENQAVTWSASCGTITSTGSFTAPESGGPCVVTATSTVDPDASGSATVAVQPAGGVTVTYFGDLKVTAGGGVVPDPLANPPGAPTDLVGAGCMDDPVPFVAPSASFTCTMTSAAANSTNTSDINYQLGYSDELLPQVHLTQSVNSNAAFTSSNYIGQLIGNAFTRTETRFEVTELIEVTFTVSIADVESVCGSGSSEVSLLVNGQWHDLTENGLVTLRMVTNRFFFVSVTNSSSAIAGRLGDGRPETCLSGAGSGSATVDVTMEAYDD